MLFDKLSLLTRNEAQMAELVVAVGVSLMHSLKYTWN